jgi:hypothetical protein
MPNDMNRMFSSVAPNSNSSAGAKEISVAFRTMEALSSREIPRSGRPDLMDRDYRSNINLLLLQFFGLGARQLGSGQLRPIDTEFSLTDWPSPVTEPTQQGQRAAPSAEEPAEPLTWQQLLPLLTRAEETSR